MTDLTGKTLAGRYRVEASIGRGGMAEVYKVWDEERAAHLALKLLREDMAQDPVFLRRFRREAQTLAKLQHPHIVRFYGLEQDDLLAFMLMDHVEGTSLRAEIFRAEGKPLPPERIMEIMRPVCSALHYAHHQGMVHCDVKPGNILIDKSGRVLVSDFGIARMTESATATMVGAGTPAYMAPEQARGENPSPQTDIYALGVVLFEMLTGGERPFTGEHARTTGSTSEKVRWEQMHLQPPSIRQVNPSISPELEAVVMKCLEKEPEKRYASVMDLFVALGQNLSGAGQPAEELEEELETEAAVSPFMPAASLPQPISEPPRPYIQPPPPPPTQRSSRRAWVSALAILWLGLAVFAGAGGAVYFTNRANQRATATAQARATATMQAIRTATSRARATATAQVATSNAISTSTAAAESTATANAYSTALAIAQATEYAMQTQISAAQTATQIAWNATAAAKAKADIRATAMAPATWYITSLGARVTSIQFFIEQSKRYGTRFDADEVDTICVQINLTHSAAGYRREFRMDVIRYDPGGGTYDWYYDQTVEASWANAYFWTCSGDYYPTGTYQVDVFVDGIKVAKGEFEIY